jgi:hypothetical protein
MGTTGCFEGGSPNPVAASGVSDNMAPTVDSGNSKGPHPQSDHTRSGGNNGTAAVAEASQKARDGVMGKIDAPHTKMGEAGEYLLWLRLLLGQPRNPGSHRGYGQGSVSAETPNNVNELRKKFAICAYASEFTIRGAGTVDMHDPNTGLPRINSKSVVRGVCHDA